MKAYMDTATVLVEAHRDLHRMGQCKKMLVAPDLFQALVQKIKEQNRPLVDDSVMRVPVPVSQVFFMQTQVVECESLEGLEYAFVRKEENQLEPGVSDG